MVDRYKNGMGCEEGFHAALGVTMTQAETDWQTDGLGRNITQAAAQNLLPYIVIGLIALIPVGISLVPLFRRKQVFQEKPNV